MSQSNLYRQARSSHKDQQTLSKSDTQSNIQRSQNKFVFLPQLNIIRDSQQNEVGRLSNPTVDSKVNEEQNLSLMKPAEIEIYNNDLIATQRISSGQTYLEQALAYRTEERWTEAIQACEAALALDPELVEAYKILGDANQKLGKYSSAIGYYGRAIAIKPDFPEAYANLGSLYAQQSKWQQALDYYQKALAIKPDLAGVYSHIAKVKQHLSPQDTEVDAANIYLEQALAYREESNWLETIRACETALELNPKLVEAYKLLGDAYQGLGKFSTAIGYYGKAIAIKPDFPEAYANLGTLYAQQKQWQQALDYYQKALEIKPDLTDVYKHVARVFQNLGQPEKAQKMLAQAEKIESQSQLSPQQFFSLGEQAARQGNLNQALKYYQQAVQLAPNFGQAYQRLAAITEKMGLWQESTIYYRQLLQLKDSGVTSSLPPARKQLSLKQHFASNNPSQQKLNLGLNTAITSALAPVTSADSQLNQGNFHAKQRQWREAIQHYQKAIELNPKLAAAYRNLARVLSQIGKVEQATSYWLKAIELDAQGLQADEYFQLGKNLLNQRKISQAITCYRRAIQLRPTLIDAYLELGNILTQAGEKEQALVCYQKAIKHNPQNPQLYFNLGLCFSRQKNWEQAISCYQQALQIKSDYWEALHNLAGALSYQKLWSEAIAVYSRAIKLKPDQHLSYNDLGLVLLQANRVEGAIAVLRKAVSLKPDYAWAHYNLGDALTAANKWAEAISAYQAGGKIQSNLPHLHSKLGHALFQQSEQARQTALEHFMQAIAQEPNNISNYHQALAIDKNNLELYLRLGNQLIEQKNLDEAIIAYQMAVQLQPKNVEATIRLTNALMEKHPETDVKKLVERLISLPTSALKQKAISSNPVDPTDLNLPQSDHPLVSIIIPVFNKLDYTCQCLASLARHLSPEISVEVIVVNDCSEDNTQEILEQVAGVTLVNNEQNLGFIHSCNRGAAIAQGKYLYFLNNDTQIRPEAIESLMEVLQSDRKVGAVGSKLIYPDGSLQEAGGIIWQDATGWNYGRNDNAFAPQYNYLREVDYCSGASLMVRKVIFDAIGGFNPEFAPAYYEDTDLCFIVRHKLGLKVIYQPKSEVVHYEGVSSGTSIQSGVKQYQVVNAGKFQQKWRQVLETNQYLANRSRDNLPQAARKYQGKKTILVIDSYMPCYDKESGAQRLFHLLKIFRELDYHVIFAADNGFKDEPYNRQLQKLQIETLYTENNYKETLEEQITARLSLVDLAWICRPELNEKYLPLIRLRENIKIIYDTIDLHYLRMKRAWELSPIRDVQEASEWQNMQQRELNLAQQADLTITVTAVEQEILRQQEINSVEVVPNIHLPRTHENQELDLSFAARENLLFIGNYNHPPNVDAVLWLCREIMPLVWEKLPSVKVTLLGSHPTKQVQSLASDRVKVTGYIADVGNYFFSHRIFVSPLRYGAGMKGKIGQSLEYALPVISTAIGIEGMSLTPEENVLEANTTEEFARQILRLYQTEEVWQKLVNNCSKAISIFTPEAVKQKIDPMIKNLTISF